MAKRKQKNINDSKKQQNIKIAKFLNMYAVPKKPLTAIRKSQCQGCFIPHDNQILFCSPCGCLLCYSCCKIEGCKKCSVTIHRKQLNLFYKTYCSSCKKMGSGCFGEQCKECQMGQVVRDNIFKKELLLNKRKLDNSQTPDMTCVVCLDKLRSYMVFPCLHLCYCQDCIEKVQKLDHRQCPLCMTMITNKSKVYY